MDDPSGPKAVPRRPERNADRKVYYVNRVSRVAADGVWPRASMKIGALPIEDLETGSNEDTFRRIAQMESDDGIRPRNTHNGRTA
jgi:hypothetical protein